MKKHIVIFLSLILMTCLHAQDTFSIVASDPSTGEVGSAGASCVDLSNFNLQADFLGQLLPGVGAINTQASYVPANQTNAMNRMKAGDSPQQIISWLVSNDVQFNPNIRQYGIVRLVDNTSSSAAYTGANTQDYKGHKKGDTYAIQGNILSGPGILDQMEANFLNTQGSLPTKLMAALQGANVIGADSRCTENETSALFAFLKVAKPDDIEGSPSFIIGVITKDGDKIEPIDSLQKLFDEKVILPTSDRQLTEIILTPTTNSLMTVYLPSNVSSWHYTIMDDLGRPILKGQLSSLDSIIDVSPLPSGIYYVQYVAEEDEIKGYSKFSKL